MPHLRSVLRDRFRTLRPSKAAAGHVFDALAQGGGGGGGRSTITIERLLADDADVLLSGFGFVFPVLQQGPIDAVVQCGA
jgi:hypothetical protein